MSGISIVNRASRSEASASKTGVFKSPPRVALPVYPGYPVAMATLKDLHDALNAIMRTPAGVLRTDRGPDGVLKLRFGVVTPEPLAKPRYHGWRFTEAEEETVLYHIWNVADRFTLVNGSTDAPPTLYFHKGVSTLLVYYRLDRGYWYADLYPSLPRPSYHQRKELKELLKYFGF